MSNLLSRRWLWMPASLVVLALAGCASIRPISSKPPLAKITLSTPYTTSGWHGMLPPTKYSVILPAGEYRPMYEDDQNYYYQAPSKVVVNDPGSLLFDGGMYIARGTAVPAGWYYVEEDGSQTFGPFKAPPPFRR